MVGTAAVLGMAAVALGLVLTPGPNMIYLVSRSVTQGRRAGLVSLLGVGVGFLVYLVVAATGLAVVFTVVPPLYLAVKVAGAGYLLWLAWRAVRPGGGGVFTPEPLPPDSTRRLFTMGLLTNLLNPKIAVLYLALLPQFLDPARGHLAEQSLVLGSVQIAVGLTVDWLIVLGAGAVAVFLERRPGWARAQRYLVGSVLAALAVRLLTQRATPAAG